MSVQGKISDYCLPCPALTYDCGHKLPLGPGMFVELQGVGRDARQPVPLGTGNCAMRACPPGRLMSAQRVRCGHLHLCDQAAFLSNLVERS
jgi:hypothetical protein